MDLKIAYTTEKGILFEGKVEDFINSNASKQYKGLINLIFTSPPFPLNRKKKYDNLQGQEYVNWLTAICKSLVDYLSADGSIVIEVGNSWESGLPTMSTLSIETLLSILKECNLHLCQQFIWYNTAKLPSPAQWVNVKRVRVKDSFTQIWWMSKISNPKANNRNILKEYSSSMKKLLKTKKYNSGIRPSEHNIGEESFFKNNEGAIPSNVLISSNTQSSNKYLNYCRKNNIELHPARMPIDLPVFFIKFLTDTNDLIMDPFGGSNTTGEAAESLKRKWIVIEPNINYVEGSKGRFTL